MSKQAPPRISSPTSPYTSDHTSEPRPILVMSIEITDKQAPTKTREREAPVPAIGAQAPWNGRAPRVEVAGQELPARERTRPSQRHAYVRPQSRVLGLEVFDPPLERAQGSLTRAAASLGPVAPHRGLCSPAADLDVVLSVSMSGGASGQAAPCVRECKSSEGRISVRAMLVGMSSRKRNRMHSRCQRYFPEHKIPYKACEPC